MINPVDEIFKDLKKIGVTYYNGVAGCWIARLSEELGGYEQDFDTREEAKEALYNFDHSQIRTYEPEPIPVLVYVEEIVPITVVTTRIRVIVEETVEVKEVSVLVPRIVYI